MDVDGKNVFMGKTTRYGPVVNSDFPPAQKMMVINEKGESKLIVLDRVTTDKLMDQLRECCIRKFQIKKKKATLKFFTQKGTAIEDGKALCQCVEQNEQIVFRMT